MRVEAYIPRDDKWAKFEHMSQGDENLKEVAGYLITPNGGYITIRLIDETIEEGTKMQIDPRQPVKRSIRLVEPDRPQV